MDDDASLATMVAENITSPENDPIHNKEAAGTTPVELKVVTDKLYLDVHLSLPKQEVKQTLEDALLTLFEKLKSWFEQMQWVSPTFLFTTIDPDGPLITELRDATQFPTKYAEIRNFFKQASPWPFGGKLYMKVRASFDGTSKQLLQEATYYHQPQKEGEFIGVSTIQAFATSVIRCLLYSLKTIDTAVLMAAIAKELS